MAIHQHTTWERRYDIEIWLFVLFSTSSYTYRLHGRVGRNNNAVVHV